MQRNESGVSLHERSELMLALTVSLHNIPEDSTVQSLFFSTTFFSRGKIFGI